MGILSSIAQERNMPIAAVPLGSIGLYFTVILPLLLRQNENMNARNDVPFLKPTKLQMTGRCGRWI